MKEISYEGPLLDNKEGKKSKKKRSAGSDVAPTIRTYRSDVQELLRQIKMTKTQVVIAETARREARGEKRLLHEQEDSHLGRIIFILLIVLSFGLGIGAYVLFGIKADIGFLKPTPTTEKVEKPKTKEIIISNSPREQIFADISITFGEASLSSDDDAQTIIFAIKDNEGVHPATTAALLSALTLSPLPDSLLRSFADIPEYGIRLADNTKAAFLVLHSRSYPNTFAGILQWEDTMGADIGRVVSPFISSKNALALYEKKFESERVGTHDARVLKNADGDEVIAYAFADKQTLVISNSAKSLSVLLPLYAKTVL